MPSETDTALSLLRSLGRAGNAADVLDRLDSLLPLTRGRSWRAVAFYPRQLEWPGKLSMAVGSKSGRDLVYRSASSILEDYTQAPACVVSGPRKSYWLLTRDTEDRWLDTSALSCSWDGFNLTKLEVEPIAGGEE
jgi:hypothetical protein